MYLNEFLSSSATKATTIRNLVFQGGSVQGLAYIGALRELLSDSKYNFNLAEVQRIGGVSAGAIFALLFGVGYSFAEVEQIFAEIDFSIFLDGEHKDDFLKIKNKLGKAPPATSFQLFFQQLMRSPMRYRKLLYKLQHDSGLFAGEYFRNWVEEKIFNKTGVQHLTFAELASLKQNNTNFKHLYFIGTNIVTSRSEVFSCDHTPDMIISDAVRISVSLPFLFMPHQFYEKQNGARILAREDHFYVDGGVVDNYPIWLFDNTKYLNDAVSHYQIPLTINPETLGFRLIASARNLPHFQAVPTVAMPDPIPGKKRGFLTFIVALIACYIDKQESDHWHRSDSIRTIYIDVTQSSMFDFDITEEIRQMLIDSGRKGVIDYYQQIQAQKNSVAQENSISVSAIANRKPIFTSLNRAVRYLRSFFF